MMRRKLIITLIVSFTLIIIIPASSANDSLENIATIYYANAHVEYSKTKTSSYYVFSKNTGIRATGGYYSFNANLEDFTLEIVVNYTAEMNYNNINFPFIALSPIIAFGLKIENYTDYQWQSLKLKHFDNDRREGSISVEIPFDMDTVKSGDTFCFDPTVAIVGDPKVYRSKDLQFSKYTSFLLRIAYHIPLLNKLLLEKRLLPFIAEHDWGGFYDDIPKIYIGFE